MNKEKLIYILKQNESLKMQVKRYEDSLSRLQTRCDDTEIELTNFKKKYDYLKEQFKDIVRKTFPREFIEQKMKTWSEKELDEFITTRIIELEDNSFKLSEDNKKVLEELKITMSELERLKKVGPISSVVNNSINENEDNKREENNIEEDINSISGIKRPQNLEDNSNPILGIMGLIKPEEWPIIKRIGEGESMFSDISNSIGISNSILKDILTELQGKGIINLERVNSGGKGRPAHHHFLTPLGTQVYAKKFSETPEKNTLQKLSATSSTSHGGLMHEVGKILEGRGLDIEYDGPDTTYSLRDGRKIIFDIKAYDPKTKEVTMYETERAHCGPNHLHEKFDKCLMFSTQLLITKTVYIIAPDKKALGEIQQQLFKWVRKNQDKVIMLQQNQIDKAVIIFHTATLEEFKKEKSQAFFYGIK